MEEWKVAFEDYEISNLGNCRRKLKNGNYKVINGSLMSTPASKNKVYKMRYFQLKRNGKRTNYLFSHLVAKCFIGERPEGYDVDHIDINPLNNNVANLRYVTHRENCLNQKRTIDIPIDSLDRKKLVQLKWETENKDKILQKKKEYYQANKDKWETHNEKRKNDRIELICPECNNKYSIQRRSQTYKKTNICSKCNSSLQLKKINDNKKE
jgi:hypothetical protein